VYNIINITLNKDFIMKYLRNTLILILIIGVNLSYGSTFEQNGVKEGNERVSITLLTGVDNNAKSNITLEARYGHFITENIELLFTANTYIIESLNNIQLYTMGVGTNIYFAKSPILTPYIGSTVFHYIFGKDVENPNTHKKRFKDASLNGIDIHTGLHYFLNENTSITPVMGAQFLDFEDYSQSYLNLYITYFF